MIRVRHRRSWAALLGATVLVALACVAPPAMSADSGEGAAALLSKRIAAGDLKYRDNRTGEVVIATEARVAEIRASLEPLFKSPESARIDVADDGTVSVDPNGAIRDVYVVRTRIDGTRERGCFRDLDAAVAFVVGLDIDAARSGGARPSAAVTE